MSAEAETLTPPPLPPSPLEQINDFSDRISPMLVKELRQGLRTHSFLILFLTLQAFLALILLTTAAADTQAGDFISGIIFSFFAIAVLVIQPLRGISAISSEIKENTIDLMVLTRLSAWRIAFGKWTSIVSQSALLLIGIVPYLILRYFFGGMQLFPELLALFSIFFLSGVFTAITVGISASTLGLVRLVPLLFALFLAPFIFRMAFGDLSNFLELFTPTTTEQWLALLAFYGLGAYVSYFFLELGVGAIAPTSENRATLKRLITAVVLIASFAAILWISEPMAWGITSIFLIAISLDIFSGFSVFPSIIAKPFVQRGALGKLAGRFLYPGWATGTFFHLLLSIIVLTLGYFFGSLRSDPDTPTILIMVLGIIHFPLFLSNLFRQRIKRPMTLLIAIHALSFLVLTVLSILDNVFNDDKLVYLFSFIPHLQFELVEKLNRGRDTGIFAYFIYVNWLYVIANVIYALIACRKLKPIEAEATAMLHDD